MSERSRLDLTEIAFSSRAEKPLEYILQTLQPLSGQLIVPVSVTAWSRHGRRDEWRRHHAVNAVVIPDCRQIAFCAERSDAARAVVRMRARLMQILDLVQASTSWLTHGQPAIHRTNPNYSRSNTLY